MSSLDSSYAVLPGLPSLLSAVVGGRSQGLLVLWRSTTLEATVQLLGPLADRQLLYPLAPCVPQAALVGRRQS